MTKTIRTDVLIVGAGPTGLSLACQLARQGVGFVVVEKSESVTPYSKAIGVHARTLEIYEQLGLAGRAVEEGAIAGRVRLLSGGEVRGEFDLSHVGEGMSAYPFVLMLEQSKNERLLYEYLRARGEDVRWNTELESFSQTQTGVTAQVRAGDGASHTVEAQFLVGCDGAKSPVRHALGLSFEGSTFERTFYVADARVEWSFGHDSLCVSLSKETFVIFFPLKGERRFRIVGVFPEGFSKDAGEVLYEEIEARIKEEAQLRLDIHDVEWFSTYKVHARHVSRFREGRCFLAGDAAHVHSPAGAQGMNTGIQDAYNLAWKLALAVKGEAGDKLLETYNEERLENAENLLRTTDRMFQLAAGPDWLLSFVRTNVFPSVAGFLFRLDSVKNFVFPLVSQIGINYRRGSLSRHAGDAGFKVKAGDRLPYLLLDGESVYDRLRQPKFHLLLFDDARDARDAADALRPATEGTRAALLDLHSFPLAPQVAEAFGTDRPFAVLLRPDNYVGFISESISKDELDGYLRDFAGVR
jgi:2-polyprenyl-6-methoxyphenol hydroxylase-like FAD-dependent oxidoreductase